MTKAVIGGAPKRMIEPAAARRQAAVDKGEEVIVGVNKYRREDEDPIEILDIDNAAVRNSQIRRIEQTKRRRDTEAVRAALAALREVAATGKGNILEAAVEAARFRATIGEISDVLREVFGDYEAQPEVVEKVYAAAYAGEPELTTLVSRLEAFSKLHGAKPKLMVAKLGQDGHDRGEDHCIRVRRSRLRSDLRSAFPDAGRGRRIGDRVKCSRSRRVVARGGS